jgi:hypothetical protein
MTVQNVGQALAEYRDVREQLERAILPIATSVDGRRFSFQTSLHGLELEAGGYVTIEDDAGARLGQLLSLEMDFGEGTGPGLPQVRIRFGRGEGAVLEGEGRPFHGPMRWAHGSSGSGRAEPRCPWASSRWLPACRSSSTARGSAGTRSCAASPGPGRRIRSAFSWSGF